MFNYQEGPADWRRELITYVADQHRKKSHTEDTSLRDTILLREDTGQLVSNSNPEMAIRQEVLYKMSYTASETVSMKTPENTLPRNGVVSYFDAEEYGSKCFLWLKQVRASVSGATISSRELQFFLEPQSVR